MKIYNNITEIIGNTPIVKLNQLTKNIDATILLKLEFMNPGSSVKDRPAISMIKKALSENKIKKDTILIEATSGNMGIGLAMVAAAFGLKLTIVMPDSMSIERQKILQAYGTDLILTPGKLGMSGAVKYANELCQTNKNYLMLSQFENQANPEIHFTTTAEEIWRDTDGKIDILVAGVGTGGTITGIAESLKLKKPSLHVVAVEPTTSPVLSGGVASPHKIQGIGAGFIPKVLNLKIIDTIITITDDEAFQTARKVARQEGLFVGISSGAAIAAAIKIAKQAKNKTIVVIAPDNGERYLSTDLIK